MSWLVPVSYTHLMSRNKYVRGASITPWTANEFPLSDEERAKKDSKKASNKALEEITILATGGGVVSESTPEVLSMACLLYTSVVCTNLLCKAVINRSAADHNDILVAKSLFVQLVNAVLHLRHGCCKKS